MTRPFHHRLIALLLSWAMPATSVWSLLPLPISGPVEADSALTTLEGGLATPSEWTPSARPDPDDDDAVRPILECVRDDGNGAFTAHFGYANGEETPISIAIGRDNEFSPSPTGRGQPTRFQPGRTPHYPSAAFRVPFDGNNLAWTLRGPDGKSHTAMASRNSSRCPGPTPSPSPTPAPTPSHSPPPGSSCDVAVFAAKRYDRTAGPKNVHADHFDVPSWVLAPFKLTVVNGRANGHNRISSAWIKLNGAQVAGPSDFNQNVAGFERGITPTAATTLEVTLASSPGSFLTVSVCGRRGDLAAPVLTWASPASGSTTGQSSPALVVRYQDAASGGSAASGIDTSSLGVWLDEVDRTPLFTRRSDEASAQLPPALALAEGTHRLRAELRDLAGNLAEATAPFAVDLTPPTVAVAEPSAGSYLRVPSTRVRATYEDAGASAAGLDLATLRVSVNGRDRTDLFAKAAAEAVAEIDGLVAGANTLEVRVHDLAGNEGRTATVFQVDVQGPALTIDQPASGARLGVAQSEAIVHYSDDQELDLDSLAATLDAQPLTLNAGAGAALGSLGPLADGPHVLAMRIRDRAGNETEASSGFRVDTTLPELRVVQPAAGFFVQTARQHVQIDYSDAQGVDLGTLRVLVDGHDRTALFVVEASSANADLAGAAGLSNGAHRIEVELADLAGNRASASSTFSVDTQAPAVSLAQPALGSFSKNATPQIFLALDDSCTAGASAGCSGSGIDATSLLIELDGADVTGSFSVGESQAVGLPPGPLADGWHSLRVHLSDRAGNAAEATLSLGVDTLGPAVTLVTPTHDSFVNDNAPELRLVYSDPGRCTDPSSAAVCAAASGVQPGSVRVFLSEADGAGPEIEITPSLTIGPVVTQGRLAGPLGEGTHRLRVLVADLAGNLTEARSAFEIDTVAPGFAVEQPAPLGFVTTRVPLIVVTYRDDRSSVDTASLRVAIDGADRSARFVPEGTPCPVSFTGSCGRATGTLVAEEALGEGRHEVDVRGMDRAGNAAAVAPSMFTVDTLRPEVAVRLPAAGAFLGAPVVELRIAFADPSDPALPGTASGLDPSALRILIDGADRTLEFERAAAVAAATLSFDEGAHAVRVEAADIAGNATVIASTFSVDTRPPAIFPELADGSYASQLDAEGRLEVKGTLSDQDPNVSIECHAGTTTVAASRSGADWSCRVPVAEGENRVEIVARDGTGHEARVQRTLNVDRTPPQVMLEEPLDGTATAASALAARGTALDASPVSVRVTTAGGEVMAFVSGGESCAHGTAPAPCGFRFEAEGVPVGEGPNVGLTVVVRDAAGNEAAASAQLRIDRVPPAVAITSPAEGAYLRGGVLEAAGTVADEGPVAVEVNGVPATLSRVGVDAGGRELFSFAAAVPVVDGLFEVTASARDAAGNAGSAHVRLHADSTPPEIDLVSPAEDFVSAGNAVTVSGSVSDASPVSLSVDDVPVPCAGSGSCRFSIDRPLGPEGAVEITLRAQDAAGNESLHTLTGTVDRTPPTLEIVGPVEGAAVGSLPLMVQGLTSDATAVTVTVDGNVATLVGAAWQVAVDGLPEGPHTFGAIATDAAGNETTRSRDVVVDLGPPLLVVSSPESGLLTRASEVVVSGTVLDQSDVEVAVRRAGGQTEASLRVAHAPGNLPAPFGLGPIVLNEGDNALTVVATDATSRSLEIPLTVSRDSTPPSLDLALPESISRGRAGQAVATASDGYGIERVVLTLECLGSPVPPCASASETSATSPATLALTVPEGAKPGDVLRVTAEAFDRAGNRATTVRFTRIVSDGVLVGQVLADRTGLPLAEASVRILGPDSGGGDAGAASLPRWTDERGRYSLASAEPTAVLHIQKDGFTSVERQTGVASGTGTVPVDARLTPLAAEVRVGVEGGTLAFDAGSGAGAGRTGLRPLALSVAPGVGGVHRLTALSPQGLPNLLPLGYSPVAAFDWRVTEGQAPSESAVATVSDPPDRALHLVRYDLASHRWRVVAPNLAVVGGGASVPLPGAGAFAVVVADVLDPPLPVPAAGDPLEGTVMLELPATAASTGQVEPAVIPPTGGTALGSIAIRSPVALPSGTVVQADVTETYTLSSGAVASEERRTIDIVVYRGLPGAPPAGFTCPEAALCATFPVTPTRTYATTELLSGAVHLDILAGREGVRGTVAGSSAVALERGPVRILVPAGALAEDTAFGLDEQPLSAFLPQLSGVVPLAEWVVDFSGQTLSSPAEVSVASPGVSAGDALVVARVERIDGIPRLAVVALAQLLGDRIVSRPYPGLPGITTGGRYLAYRLAAPIGFVAGVASAGGAPVKALVEPNPGDPGSLPFVAVSGPDGRYTLAVAPGSRRLRARVPGTSLLGMGSGLVLWPDDGNVPRSTALDIALAGSVTTATVTPADGVRAVATTVAIEIESPTPLNPATVVPAHFSLSRLSDAPGGAASAASFRLVLSSTGKLVSLLPQPQRLPDGRAEAALDYSATYRLESTGLADAFGGLVTVPTTTFRTKDFSAPFYDPDKLAFSMPDADGIVTVTAPACYPQPGCLYPGSTVLIINSGNGVVLSLTVGNSGELQSELPATIDDTLFVTLNDPLGNSVSFKRSKYVAVDGTTAIGPGGGTVLAADGSGAELRIPEGALERGVRFKVSLLPESEYADTFPNDVLLKLMPGTTLGGVLKIESDGNANLKRYARLAFPLPDFTQAALGQRPNDPRDAFYYVNRAWRVCADSSQTCAGQDKLTLFETVDEAKVEGEGAGARIATASPPFPGMVGPLGGSVGLMLMSWSYDPVQLARPVSGMISGSVKRQRWSPGAAAPEYDPVSGAQVSGKDIGGDPLTTKDGGSFASTQSDGTFVLWDTRYSGGLVTTVAKSGAQTVEGTAYETTDTFLQRYRKRATVNLTFPAVQPPPPPPGIEIRVLNRATGSEVGGLVVAGTGLRVVFKLANDSAEIRSASVNGESRGVFRDSTAGDELNFELSGGLTPALAGSYTITANAQPAIGPLLSVTRTLRVIASGGSVDTLPNEPPRVTSVSPTMGLGGVPVTVFPEVSFTEPVKRLRDRATGEDNVALYEVTGGVLGARVPLLLAGVSPSGQLLIDQDLGSPDAAVTSLTLQAAFGLKYSQVYRLVLSEQIEDLDRDAQGNPAPKKLVRFESEFLTFGPVGVGSAVDQTDNPLTVGSPGIAVIGERAYLARTNGFVNGNLLSINIKDPLQPRLVGVSPTFAPRPFDLAADPERKLVAVAVGSTTLPKPSSVLFFDASDDKLGWLGASTLVGSAFEGFVARIALKGNYLYAATVKKGIQAVNVQKAIDALTEAGSGLTGLLGLQNVRTALNTDGGGFGQEAVEITIPIPNKPNGTAYQLTDIRVADIQSQPITVVTGEPGLIVASPQTGQLLYPPVADPFVGNVEYALTAGGQRTVKAKLTWGLALAVGRLQDKDVAIVVGNGEAEGNPGRRILMTVDLSDPSAPRGLGYVDLTDEIGSGFIPVDVQLREETALLGIQTPAGDRGFVLLVNLANLERPQFAGRIEDPDRLIGGRLAFDASGLLYSSARMTTGGQSPLGGVKTATFTVLAAVDAVRPTLSILTAGVQGTPREKTLQDTPIGVAVFPPSYAVSDAQLEIRTAGGQPVLPPIALALAQGRGGFSLPKDLVKNVADDLFAVFSFKVAGKTIVSQPRPIEIGTLELLVDSNNDTELGNQATFDGIALEQKDREAATAGKPWAFWEAADPTIARVNPTDELEDWATIKLRARVVPRDVTVSLGLADAVWSLAQKVGLQKRYLSGDVDKTVPQRQLDSLKEAVRDSSGPGGRIDVPLEWLRKGDNELLVRFRRAPSDSTSILSLDLRTNAVDPNDITLITQPRVEIKPLRGWISVYNARSDAADGRPDKEFSPRPEAMPVADWKQGIPGGTGEVTVLVHGFNVAGEIAGSDFIPTYFKRLYWSGHPVHTRQVDSAGESAHTVGFVWPGNYRASPFLPAGIYFPEDEFHALQSGVTLSRLLTNVIKPRSRKVSVIAHSLGNMVVNSALMQPGMDGVIDRYVMNDAAVPAESFSATYEYSPLEQDVLFPHARRHGFATPADEVASDWLWAAEWTEMDAGRPVAQSAVTQPDGSVVIVEEPNHADREAWLQESDDTHLFPKPLYEIRWNQNRPSEIPTTEAVVVPRRGPWRGFFGGSASKTTILNTYNPVDQVLLVSREASIDLHPQLAATAAAILPFGLESFSVFAPTGKLNAWFACQRIQKPRMWNPTGGLDIALFGRFDGRSRRFWATLGLETGTRPNEYLWGPAQNHSNLTRQWAELAFWFPSLSVAAGSVPLLVPGIRNELFAEYGQPQTSLSPEEILLGTATHSYMTDRSLAKVWGAFGSLRRFMRDGQ